MAPCRKAFLFLSLLSTTGTGSRNMGTQARPTSTLPTSRLPPKTGKQANKEDPQNSSARDANKKADWWLSQAKKCKEECICTIFNIWIAQVLEAPSFVFGSTSFGSTTTHLALGTYHKLKTLPQPLASFCTSCLPVCKPLQTFPAAGEL